MVKFGKQIVTPKRGIVIAVPIAEVRLGTHFFSILFLILDGYPPAFEYPERAVRPAPRNVNLEVNRLCAGTDFYTNVVPNVCWHLKAEVEQVGIERRDLSGEFKETKVGPDFKITVPVRINVNVRVEL